MTIREAIRAAVGEVRVARAAEVTRVRGDGTVDVQPLVAEGQWARGRLTYQLPPELPRLPVQWIRAGNASIAGRLSRGQQVLVLVRDVDHADADRESAGDKPTSRRRFDWSDAVVLAGFSPRDGWPDGALPSSPADLVAFLGSGGSLLVGGAGADKNLARNDLLQNNLTAIAAALDIIADAAGVENPYAATPTGTGRIKVDA